MQIFTARTCETYDVDALCEDLGRQIAEHVTFGERTLGIAVCDSTINYPAVMRKLSEMYSFDIYGATALAFIGIHSVQDISVSFMIITGGEELVGSMALSEPCTHANKETVIRDTYRLARERLGEEPKMILCLQPFDSCDFTADFTTSELDAVSGHCPIYGAVSSSDLSNDISGVFVNGEFYTDRILLNLLGGGIRPLFAVRTIDAPPYALRAIITESTGNLVRRVGEETFLSFMQRNGLIIDPAFVQQSVIASYCSSPVILRLPQGGKLVEQIRTIIGVDYETGAVTLSGDMPQGCEVLFGVLSRDLVVESTVACFEEMIAKINENTSDAYRYSTLFSTSCGARYLIMTGDTSTEGRYITHHPALKDLASCGFYAMGEMCPISINADGTANNRAYNASVTLMAL